MILSVLPAVLPSISIVPAVLRVVVVGWVSAVVGVSAVIIMLVIIIRRAISATGRITRMVVPHWSTPITSAF